MIADARQRAIDIGSEQASVLRRGIPTTEEYKTATYRAIECARDQGVDIERVHEESDGLLLDYLIGEPIAVYDACYEKHAMYIDIVYQLSIERQLWELERPVIECVRDSGVDVSAVLDPDTGVRVDGSQLKLGVVLSQMSSADLNRSRSCIA